MWILFFASGSLVSARHIPLFIVMALPLVGLALNELWVKFTAGKFTAVPCPACWPKSRKRRPAIFSR